MSADFYILGMPLLERTDPSSHIKNVIEKSLVIIGESRRVTERLLSRLSLMSQAKVFYLDNQSLPDQKILHTELKALLKKGGTACLFSDMGMPILFDPGKGVLDLVRELGYHLRCLPGPTSWGTACAVSGWEPPFLLIGFLSPKVEERLHELAQLKNTRAHLVLMDTPYRFQALLKDSAKVFGPQQKAFLAWEIGNSEETYLWGSLSELELIASQKNLKKGEFILLLHNPGVK